MAKEKYERTKPHVNIGTIGHVFQHRQRRREDGDGHDERRYGICLGKSEFHKHESRNDAYGDERIRQRVLRVGIEHDAAERPALPSFICRIRRDGGHARHQSGRHDI